MEAADAGVCARRPVILSAHVAPSTHGSRDPNDQGYGDCGRVPARPDRYARYPCAATRQGLGVPVDVVQRGTEVRLAPSSPPRTPRQAEGRPANDATYRDVAHRDHGNPPTRWDPGLRARGDRQLLSTDLGVARR